MNPHRLFVTATILAGALVSLTAGSPSGFPASIATEGGTVVGTTVEGVLAYKGIPYARPPVGDLRWRAPQAVTPWQGARDASRMSADCMQAPLGPPPPGQRHPVSEDCLYLNIWRPSAESATLPVMVWIHGGGFVNGGSSSPDSTGESMAARGLVVVSFNYRLGRFGSFGFPALTSAHPDEGSNFGILDQIAALRWIRRNIAAFGGDPGNVTVVGESAGGMSINILMTSPAASGLFERAIIQSGAGRKLPRERHLAKDLPGAASATTLGRAFAKRWNITGDDAGALAALRALSAEQVTDGLNMMTVLIGDTSMYAGPVIDGRVIVETPEAGYAAVHQQRVPLIVGATTWDLGLNLAKTPDEAFAAFGPDADAARRAYDPAGRGDMQAINTAIAGDRTMVEPARFIARAMRAAGLPAYVYRFSYVLDGKRAQSPYGAQHATDVAYAFDRLKAFNGDVVTAADERVADAMADYWANFARTGDPNGEGLPAWPLSRPPDERLLDFEAGGHVVAKADPWRERLDIAARAVARAERAATVAARFGELPASFEGELPCADCAGIRYHLDVFHDGLYFLRRTYAGTEQRADAVGGWVFAADNTRLVLDGGRPGPVAFAIEDARTLRWLERGGPGVGTPTTHVLARGAAFQPIEPRLTLSGMYRKVADRAAFTPCGTQRHLSVASEAERAALDAAYAKVVSDPEGEALVRMDARIAMRPPNDGEGVQPTVVVERLVELQPGGTCGPRRN